MSQYEDDTDSIYEMFCAECVSGDCGNCAGFISGCSCPHGQEEP